jgi:hypothetical protein
VLGVLPRLNHAEIFNGHLSEPKMPVSFCRIEDCLGVSKGGCASTHLHSAPARLGNPDVGGTHPVKSLMRLTRVDGSRCLRHMPV